MIRIVTFREKCGIHFEILLCCVGLTTLWPGYVRVQPDSFCSAMRAILNLSVLIFLHLAAVEHRYVYCFYKFYAVSTKCNRQKKRDWSLSNFGVKRQHPIIQTHFSLRKQSHVSIFFLGKFQRRRSPHPEWSLHGHKSRISINRAGNNRRR